MSFLRLPDEVPDALEQRVLEQWREEGLFHAVQDARRASPPFVFYEGPPTANGRPGIHHVFARTIKDLICRYQSMLGRSVTRIAGWDTHGLPVEIEVEKELQITGKSGIEAYGVAEFNRRCRESVFRYKTDWEALSSRIGYWLDYDHPYVTYTPDYIESVWWLLEQLWRKDLLYEGHKVLPYCGRCGTALSSHELAMGYATHRSPSIHVLFRVLDDAAPPRHLLVWTTTPWTLPSNIAVAVHPDFTYVELDIDGTHVIVEQRIAASKVVPGATGGRPLGEYPAVAEYPGRQLIGWRYEPLLDAVPIDADRAFRVVAGEFVTSEEGTGLVHMAPAFGADDYHTIQREGLAFVNPVDQNGRFDGTAWDAINGLTVFEANQPIADRLAREGKLFGRYDPQGYEHTYPFCWRCDSPLIYYARRSWFVRTTAYKDRMVELNRAVDWHPSEIGQGRFGEWLENNVDWALSRDRYWGTPLPAWVCDADREHTIVIGSFDTLAARAGRSLGTDFDPHKPYIDEITFGCDRCQGTMRRVPEVIDAWFDSGAMPYAQWHYPFEHEQEHERHFPADYICEGLDQTRGWFYSLLAITAGVSEREAYQHVIVNGLLLDAEGRKMSKRLGNVVDPWEAIRDVGADALRVYLLVSGQVWLPKRFDPGAVMEQAGGFLNRLRNTYNFLAQYAVGGAPADPPPVDQRPLADRWLVNRVRGLVRSVRAAWDDYDVRMGARSIVDFCDNELSNWYVRLNRARFWAPDSTPDAAAVATLHDALITIARLLAPAAPFMSDAIHRNLTGTSVHLADFPEGDGPVDPALDEAMEVVRKLASLARYAREDGSVRTRQPLSRMRVAVPPAIRGAAFNDCLELLAREVNVRNVEIVDSDADLVRLRAKPNFRSLGKVYGKATPAAAQAAGRLTAQQLRTLEEGQSVALEDNGQAFTYRPEDVLIEREVSTDWLVRSDGPLVAALDPHLTTELRQEGVARELVNRVQRLRKDAGYEYTTRVALGIEGPDDILAAAKAFVTFIAGETLARDIELGVSVATPDVRRSVDLDGQTVTISLRQYEAEGE